MSEETATQTYYLMVDATCSDKGCALLQDGEYVMIGSCVNCRQGGVLVSFTRGHRKRSVECPTCGCTSVETQRLATEGEITLA